MPTSPLSVVIQHLLAHTGPDGDRVTDEELLARFLRSRDGNALAALVRRHASMVWGVCCRLLHSHHDAEDAFQATFLVLVRKASDVPGPAVANWLYGVARQTAVRLRATAAKRGRRETQVANMPEATMPEVRDADSQSLVDEELSRLPDHYRSVVVLCDLEDMTRKQAAQQLGIPEGSVASRLARARAMLAKRLAQRSIVCSGSVMAVLSAGSASASAPPAPVAFTIKAASLLAAGRAGGVISAKVTALTEGVVKAMFVSKIKAALSVVLIFGLVATGATLLSYRTAAGQDDKKPTVEKPVEPAAKQKEKDKEAFTAWGKEVGGLQAGLGYEPGAKRVHHPGETVKLVVRVRNVGKEEVSFQYLRHFFIENPPTGMDDKGKAVALKDGSPRGIYKPVDVTLAVGKEIELYELSLTLRDKATDDTPQASTLYGEGKFQLQYERVLGDSLLSSVSIKTDPILRTLATGKLELEVKDADKKKKQEKAKEAFTAWGKEAGGLQAGLGFRPGEKRAYHPGETVRLLVRVRNVGKKEMTASYDKEFFDLNQLVVTDSGGKRVDIEVAEFTGSALPQEVTLSPGAEVTLGEISVVVWPMSGRGKDNPAWTILGTSKLQLQYPTIGGNNRVEKGPFDLGNLATGKLELEVKEDR